MKLDGIGCSRYAVWKIERKIFDDYGAVLCIEAKHFDDTEYVDRSNCGKNKAGITTSILQFPKQYLIYERQYGNTATS